MSGVIIDNNEIIFRFYLVFLSVVLLFVFFSSFLYLFDSCRNSSAYGKQMNIPFTKKKDASEANRIKLYSFIYRNG